MADQKRIDAATGTETVGHEWDGIEELDTPMPRWWLYTLYATILFSIVYVALFPAFPMLHRASAGLLGWSSQQQFDAEMRSDAARKAPIRLAIARTPVERLAANPALLHAAEEGGRAAFRVNCIQCHGSGAAGAKGYPNLNDDDWLWGGDIKAVEQTVLHGIRQPDDPATRLSQMPAFGRDGILKPAEIDDVASFVRVISHQAPHDSAARRGGVLFAVNCAVCHGADGTGNRQFGAPNLTDAIWLYGGDRATIIQTVTRARYGVMPAWAGRLDPVTVKMLAAFVHSLGGGEALPAATVVAAAETSHGQP